MKLGMNVVPLNTHPCQFLLISCHH